MDLVEWVCTVAILVMKWAVNGYTWTSLGLGGQIFYTLTWSDSLLEGEKPIVMVYALWEEVPKQVYAGGLDNMELLNDPSPPPLCLYSLLSHAAHTIAQTRCQIAEIKNTVFWDHTVIFFCYYSKLTLES